jgi:hypothetical protein
VRWRRTAAEREKWSPKEVSSDWPDGPSSVAPSGLQYQ